MQRRKLTRSWPGGLGNRNAPCLPRSYIDWRVNEVRIEDALELQFSRKITEKTAGWSQFELFQELNGDRAVRRMIDPYHEAEQPPHEIKIEALVFQGTMITRVLCFQNWRRKGNNVERVTRLNMEHMMLCLLRHPAPE
jgi:hypothetical protein